VSLRQSRLMIITNVLPILVVLQTVFTTIVSLVMIMITVPMMDV
jgi:hypothetical protein